MQLRAEGFTDISYVATEAGIPATLSLARGEVDFSGFCGRAVPAARAENREMHANVLTLEVRNAADAFFCKECSPLTMVIGSPASIGIMRIGA